MKPSASTNRYTCYHCGCHFEELDLVEEKPHHWIGVCPRCGRCDRLLSSNDMLKLARTGMPEPLEK